MHVPFPRPSLKGITYCILKCTMSVATPMCIICHLRLSSEITYFSLPKLQENSLWAEYNIIYVEIMNISLLVTSSHASSNEDM